MTATQVKRPWRTTVRSAFQNLVAAAALFPVIVAALPEQAAAPIAGLLAVLVLASTTITRIMAVPAVNEYIKRFLPWLAPEPPREDV